MKGVVAIYRQYIYDLNVTGRGYRFVISLLSKYDVCSKLFLIQFGSQFIEGTTISMKSRHPSSALFTSD